MSFELVDRVIDLPGMHATEKVVLASLAQRANHDGTSSFPGQEYLAMRANVSTRAVRYSVDHLELHGYLKIGQQRRAPDGAYLTNDYQLTIDQGVPCTKGQQQCVNGRDREDRRKLTSCDSVSSISLSTLRATRGRVRTHVLKWASQHSSPKDFDSVSRAVGSQLPTVDDDPKDIDWTPPEVRPVTEAVDLTALRQRAEGLTNGSAA